MNLAFDGIWVICDLPLFDIESEPGDLLLPVTESVTVQRPFAGGFLLRFLYDFYQESVSYPELSNLLIQEIRRDPVGGEAYRLTRLLNYCSLGTPVNRLDVLGLSDPIFIGIQEGVVIVGS